MGNVNMEARQVHYRGGNKPMSVEEAIKEAGSSYVLPIAGSETLGGVIVGEGLTIDSETGVLSADSQIVDYSTDEQLTGRKWIDGSDIYFKTVEFGALPNNAKKSVASGLTGETIIKMYGIAKSGSDYSPLPSTATNAIYTVTLGYDAADHEIDIYTATDMTSYNAYIVLYYTKTT